VPGNITFCQCIPIVLPMAAIYLCHFILFVGRVAQSIYRLTTGWTVRRSNPGSGFGGLVVSMLASGTQDRGFASDRSRRIFPAGKIHSMPSHVPALEHVKEPSSLRKIAKLLAKFHKFLPSLAGCAVCLANTRRPLVAKEGSS
jgi:hypothetical protein